MISRNKGRITSRVGFSMLVAVSLGCTTIAHSACYPPQTRLPQDQIQSFLSNPKALLTSNPFGGSDMSDTIGKLVASDNAALPVVIQLLGSANPQQRYSLGIGLSNAARACLIPDQAFAGLIQSQLIATGDRVAMTAFVSTGGQGTEPAAIGPGAPADTAFTSGFGEITGSSLGGNTTLPVIQPIGSIGAGVNPFIFTGSSGSSVSSRFTGSSSVPSRTTSP